MAKLTNNKTGEVVEVHSTSVHPSASYGQPIWVDNDNNPICTVGMESPWYSVELNIREQIGQRIKVLRKINDVSQRDLAEKSGITPANIANIELGRYSVGLDVLYKIVDALHCDIEITEKK